MVENQAQFLTLESFAPRCFSSERAGYKGPQHQRWRADGGVAAFTAEGQ